MGDAGEGLHFVLCLHDGTAKHFFNTSISSDVYLSTVLFTSTQWFKKGEQGYIEIVKE